MSDGWRKVATQPLRICNALLCVIVAGVTIFLIVYWNKIPEQVPMHWNAAGEITNYSKPGGYLFLVILMYLGLLFHMLMMFIMPMFTDSANLFSKEASKRASYEDRRRGMQLTLCMLAICDLITELTFAYIIICGVRVQPMGAWFLPVIFIAFSVLFIWYFLKLHRIEKEI